MVRLLIIAVVVVLVVNWLVDPVPADPQRAADASAVARRRQAVLDTPVRVEAEGRPLSDLLDQLAGEHGLPLERVETPGESWSTPVSLQLPYAVRFEGLLELLQQRLRSFSWRWQGERLLLVQGAKYRPPINGWWAPTYLGHMPDVAAVARSCDLKTSERVLIFNELALNRFSQTFVGGTIAHTTSVYGPPLENALRRVREREVWEPVAVDRVPEAGRAREAVQGALERELTLDLSDVPLRQALQQIQAALEVNVILDLFWADLTDQSFQPPEGSPLTLVAYAGGLETRAYVEPTAVGRVLADMPLFLTPERYVLVPLEATYQAAFAGVPARWREELERG
jgi:hypothetical protein